MTKPQQSNVNVSNGLLETQNISDVGENEKRPIYLDYNGTTPIYPEVTAAMLPYFTTHFGNPSSSHYYGKAPKAAIQKARASVACLVGGSPDGIIFTGCGTEADNLAIHLALESYQCRVTASAAQTNTENLLPHVITTSVEHPAILEYLKTLQSQNKIEVTFIPVSSECQISSSQVKDAIRPNQTCLVTIMFAQNEIGSLMPIKEITKICREHGILFHTDAAQAVGKVNLATYFAETKTSNEIEQTFMLPDMITIVGHKFGAPKGIAALYIHPTNPNSEAMISLLTSSSSSSPTSSWGKSGGLLIGGGQESGRRAGTENVPYIVAMGTAADMVMDQFRTNSQHLEHMRNSLLHHLTEHLKPSKQDKCKIPDGDILRVNGPSDPTQRLPNTLSVGIRNIYSGTLLQKLGSQDVAASAGSACHSSAACGGAVSVSSVLKEMGVPMEYAVGTLRLSVGIGTTEDDVRLAASKIAREVKLQWSENEIS